MKCVTTQSEYDKNKGLRKEDIKVLSEWVGKQPHLPPVTELHLIFFLHSCHYSIQFAKKTIELFFTYRAQCPEFFSLRDPRSAQNRKQVQLADYLHMPKTTDDGCQIVLYKIFNTDVDEYDMSQQIKLFDMSVVQWLMQNGTSEGLILICDIKGATMGHVVKFNMTIARKVLLYVQDALFIRLKAIHFLHAGSFVDVLIGLMRPFVKSDLINSFRFHNSVERLSEYVPIECLPSDYGGLQPSSKELHETHMQALVDFADYFINEESYVADESKRVEKSSYINDIFGIEGSFKQLNID